MTLAQKIDISSSTIFRTVLIILGFWLLYILRDVVAILFGAFIVSSAIEPIARRLERRNIPRLVTVLSIYGIALLILGGIGGLIVEPLAHQIQALANAVPSAINAVNRLTPLVPEVDQAQLVSTIQNSLFRVGGSLANIGANVVQGTRTVISTIFTIVFVFVVALYLVLERDALHRLARLVTPTQHLSYVEQAITRAQYRVGRWALGQLVLGTVIGTGVGVGLQLLGVPYALLLGLLAGFMELIPIAGAVIAGVPGVIIALTESWWLGVATLGLYVLVGQLENHLLVPNVMRRAVGLRPIVIIIAILIGGRLAGIVGIILAVPVATMLSVIAADIFPRTPAVKEEAVATPPQQ